MSVDLFFQDMTCQKIPESIEQEFKHNFKVRCADDTGIVLLKHCKTDSHSPLIREEKRCSCLYSPTKQLAIIFSLQDREKKQKHVVI